MTPNASMTVNGMIAAQRTRIVSLGLVASAAALLLGLLAAELALSGHVVLIAILAGVAFPIIVWRRPEVGIASFVLLATSIEQFPIEQTPLSSLPAAIVTDQIPLFISFNGALGVPGVMISPLEIALFVTLLVWIMKGIVERTLHLPRSYLAIGLVIFTAVLVFGEVQGLIHGGSFRESVDELRPWLYLMLLFLVASQLLQRPAALRPILWAFVIGTGLKGVQGTIRFVLLRSAIPRPDAILAHEEAFFFALFIVLVAALWLFKEQGRLRLIATALLPAVLIADLGNNRRAAWLILLAGFMALAVIGWVRIPQRRRVIAAWAGGLTLAGSIYLAIFWNGTGSLAQPARAIRSAVAPAARDSLSDLYRTQENANLEFNIRRGGPFGAGFGIPIDYALPITDLTKTAPSLAFVPHNGILYLWMRLGSLGILVFWFLIGAAVIAACKLVRSPDRELALFGGLALCAVIAYVLEGYYDLGLSWFRVAVFMGCILGALEAIGRRQRALDRGAGGGRT